MSPNSHGAYGAYTNVAHFGGFGGAFGPYSYTCSKPAWELGTTTSINNDLATTNACGPSHPPPLPSTSYGGHWLGDPSSAHVGSCGYGTHKFHPSKV